jgi:hypothetical protein
LKSEVARNIREWLWPRFIGLLLGNLIHQVVAFRLPMNKLALLGLAIELDWSREPIYFQAVA